MKTQLIPIVLLVAATGHPATSTAAAQQQSGPPTAAISPDSRSRLPYMKASTAAIPGPLYSRGLAPEGTGPGQINRHGSGGKQLEAGVGRRTMAVAVLVT